MTKNNVVHAKETTGAAQKARKAQRSALIHADGSSDSKPGRTPTPKDKTGPAVLNKLK